MRFEVFYQFSLRRRSKGNDYVSKKMKMVEYTFPVILGVVLVFSIKETVTPTFIYI